MPIFIFEAKTVSGKRVKGQLEAQNEQEVNVKLRAKKLFPLKVKLKATKSKGGFMEGGVKAKEMQVFTRQFSTLLTAGIPVMQSLETLQKGSKNKALANALSEIINDVESGKKLAEALARHPKVFNSFYVNMIKAGEAGGVLEGVLYKLAIYIEKSVKIQGKIKGAMVYPSAIIFVAIVVIAAILIFVIPQFKELFSSMGQELPALTQMVLNMSSFIMNYWYICIGAIIFLVVGFIYTYKSKRGRRLIDTVALKIPIINNVIIKGSVANFSQTLSTLISSGVGILEAMDIGIRVVGNVILQDCFKRGKAALVEGKTMSGQLAREKPIPGMLVQMVGIGEQTGALDSMLVKVSDFYEEEVDSAVSAMLAAMEPGLLIVLGGLVGTLVIAMYLPIFNLANVVGG